MKLRPFTFVLILASLLALGSLAAACGGDSDGNGEGGVNGGNSGNGSNGVNGGNDVSPLESYFAELIALTETFEARGEAIETNVETGLERAREAPPEEQQEEAREAVDDFIEDAIDAADDFLEDLEDLDPPSEVEAPHNDLIAVFTLGIAVLDQTEDALSDAADLEEVVALRDEVTEALTALAAEAEATCVKFQGVADDSAVGVELNCGSEG